MTCSHADTVPQQNTLPPSMSKALDLDTALQVFRHRWHWLKDMDYQLDALQVHRVFPRGRNNFVIKYQAKLVGKQGVQWMDVFGEITDTDVIQHRQRVIEKLRKSKRRQIRRDQDTTAIAAAPELGMLIRVPGYDEKIPGLKLYHDHRKTRVFLKESLAASPAKGTEGYQILNHRLGKRCVLRLNWGERKKQCSIVLRCLKEGSQAHQINVRHMQALQSQGFNNQSEDLIRVPEVLGHDDELHMVMIANMPGSVLGENTDWPLEQQAALAGGALAKLHGCQPWMEQVHGVDQELKLLSDWVQLAGQLRPELATELNLHYQQVSQQLYPWRNQPLRLAHRDFYNKQLLFDGQWTTLIDFDTLCLADPALDIGNYLAHRQLARLAGEPWSADEANEFLASYAQRLILPSMDAIAAWQHAALLRLACLYATHTGWETLPSALLRQINNI